MEVLEQEHEEMTSCQEEEATWEGPGRADEAPWGGPGRADEAPWGGPGRADEATWEGPGRVDEATWEGPGRVDEATWEGPGRADEAPWGGPGRAVEATWEGPGRADEATWEGPGRADEATWEGPGRADEATWEGPGRVDEATWEGPGRVDEATWGGPGTVDGAGAGQQECEDSFTPGDFTRVMPRAQSDGSSPMSAFNVSKENEESFCCQEYGVCLKHDPNRESGVGSPTGDKGDCSCGLRGSADNGNEVLEGNPQPSPVRDQTGNDDISLYVSMDSSDTIILDFTDWDQVEKSHSLTSFGLDLKKNRPEKSVDPGHTTDFYLEEDGCNFLPTSALRSFSPMPTPVSVPIPAISKDDAHVSETMFSDCSFVNNFDIRFDDSFEGKQSISFLEGQQNSTVETPPKELPNQLPQRPKAPNTKVNKFLGTPFKRALSSSCISSNKFLTETDTAQDRSSTSESVSSFPVGESRPSLACKETGTSPAIDPPPPNDVAVTDPPLSFFSIFGPNCQNKHKSDGSKNTTVEPSKKRIKFTVPYKKKEEAKLSENLSEKQKFQPFSQKLANDVEEKIAATPPQEISMTLQYKGGFCQLNRPENNSIFYPENILLRIVWSSDVQYISAPLQKNSWTSSLVKVLFLNKFRRICFEAQEVIQALVDKFDLNTTEVSSQWLILDPLIGCWLLNPDEPPHSFKDVLTTLKLPQDCNRAEILLCKLSQSAEVLYQRLTQTGLWKIFLNIEMHITPILACMELHGIQVDVEKLQGMASLLKVSLDEVQKSAYKAAGRQFQLTSPQQLGNVMYDYLKLDIKHKISVKETEKKNNKSTSESTLIKFKDLHPLPGAVLEFRRLHKLKSTYVDALLGHVSNNCIYTLWDQISAATGRITSRKPNLQTIPKHSLMPELPHLLLRTAFVARKEYSFVAADFQHIELRVFAHLSRDSTLLEALRQPTDVFIALSQHLLQIADVNNVSQEDRDKTKCIVYALMYGAGSTKLVDILNISDSQAKKIHKKFLGTFPEVQNFIQRVLEKCRKQGYLSTETGRRRLFPNINSTNFQLRMQCERQAVNFLIQGTAADLCKCAMVHTQRQLTKLSSQESTPAPRLLLQVHDELLWEVLDADLMAAVDIVREAMEEATAAFESLSNFSVPLPAVIKVGKTWGDMKIVKSASM